MPIPAAGPAVLFTILDPQPEPDPAYAYRLVKLVGQLEGQNPNLGLIPLVAPDNTDRALIELRRDEDLTRAGDGTLQFQSQPLWPNVNAGDTDNQVGGAYTYKASVWVDPTGENDVARGRLWEYTFRFIVDGEASYTLDAGRIPVAQVSTIDPPDPLNPEFVALQSAVADLTTRHFGWVVYESDVAVAIGDGRAGVPAPPELVGWNVIGMQVSVRTPGITGTTDVQLRRERAGSAVDVFLTPVSVASGEWTAHSSDVDLGNVDIAAGDLFFVDRDAVHAVPPEGLSAIVSVQRSL